MKKIRIVVGDDPLEILRRCDGYYERAGKGPLVGYAGRDGQNRQYVGMVYANFAKAERHGNVLMHVADSLVDLYPEIARVGDGFCGAPEGGKALAAVLAATLGRGYIFPEKQVTALKTDTSRERSILVWGRHEPEPGEEWWIVEDVCNNFSTTEDLIKLIEDRGARVLGVVCFLNRSMVVDQAYLTKAGSSLPIKALVRKPIAEYTQDEPAVVADVAANNVVWKPKNEWDELPKK